MFVLHLFIVSLRILIHLSMSLKKCLVKSGENKSFPLMICVVEAPLSICSEGTFLFFFQATSKIFYVALFTEVGLINIKTFLEVYYDTKNKSFVCMDSEGGRIG